MYGQFQYVRTISICTLGGEGGGEGARITTIHTKKEKNVYVEGGADGQSQHVHLRGGWRRTTLNHNFIIPMGGWVDGWVVGGTNYTNVNLWGQTTLVYYRGTENLSMYYRGRTI